MSDARWDLEATLDIWQFIMDHATAIGALAAVATALATIAGVVIAARKRKRFSSPGLGVEGKKLKSGRDVDARNGGGKGVTLEKVEAGRDIRLTNQPPPGDRHPKA